MSQIDSGNFGAYLDSMQKAYRELREKGLDLFEYSTDTADFVVPMPIDEGRRVKEDGSLELTTRDISFFMEHGYSEVFIAKVSEGDLKIRPYSKAGSLHTSVLSAIERANNGERTRVHEVDLDLH